MGQDISLGQAAVSRLQAFAAQHTCVKEVRGAGLLLGIELQAQDARCADDLAEAVLYRCLSAGLSFKVGQGNVLVLAPHLNVAEQDLDWALDTVCESLALETA